MNSAFTRKINTLDRSQLITVAKKLGITGLTNKRKDDIRKGILAFVRKRSNSVSTLENIKLPMVANKRQVSRTKSEGSIRKSTRRPQTAVLVEKHLRWINVIIHQ